MLSRDTFTTRRVLTATALAGTALLPVLPAVADDDTLAEQMHRLRVCESSDDYRTDTGNGYYGAYQFDMRTWRGLGYGGRPDQNSPATQDRATERLHAQRGWQPWPSCARKEHLH